MRQTGAWLTFLLLVLVIALPALAVSPPKAVFVVGEKRYTADGWAKQMDAAAFVEGGRTYVPVRYLAYALGVPESGVIWSPSAGTVTLRKDGVTVSLAVGGTVMYVDGKSRQMDVAPLIRGGRVYLPARFVAEAFGYEVGWDATRQVVLIRLPEQLAETAGPDENGIDIDIREIERAIFEQINEDRAAADLSPVEWDETAARAARLHAAEMAENDYLSHWDLSGKKPQQRYTEAGGLHATIENVGYCRLEGYALSQELLLQAALEVHAQMMAEVPPDDGHRRNILDPCHTHVGVGVAYALHEDGSLTLAFAEEFTNHYYILTSVPLTARAGEKLSVSGKPLGKGGKLYAVVLLWEDFPRPMSVEDLRRTGSYSSPGWENIVSYAVEGWPVRYFPQTNARGNALYVDGEGNFAATLQTSSRPGLNYLQVWLEDSSGQRYISNEAVIQVR